MFRLYYNETCQHIYRYIPITQAVEDIAQEMFAELWTKRESIDIKTSPGAYLHRMAVSRALNYIRDNKRHMHASDEALVREQSNTASQDELLSAQELDQVIKQTIDDLPLRCRQVFMLSRFEQMKYQEISEAMGISIKTVENQMMKALKTLREAVHAFRNEEVGGKE